MLNAIKQLEGFKAMCNQEGSEMLGELIRMLSLSGSKLDEAMEDFRNRYGVLEPPGIEVGDECYYCTSPIERFIVTKIWLGKDGLDHPAYFFDGIYHDGTTISDGNLQIIHKTGNYYPIIHALVSPFDELPAEVKKNGKV